MITQEERSLFGATLVVMSMSEKRCVSRVATCMCREKERVTGNGSEILTTGKSE